MCESCKKVESEKTSESQRAQWLEAERRIEWLRTMPYREYLSTAHWQEIRAQRIRSAKYRCQLCNSGGQLDVHHRTYENRGCEQWADLIVLCRPCHAKHHDRLP